MYLQLLTQHHTESQPAPTAGDDSNGRKALLTDAKTSESQTAMQQTLATNAILQQVKYPSIDSLVVINYFCVANPVDTTDSSIAAANIKDP